MKRIRDIVSRGADASVAPQKGDFTQYSQVLIEAFFTEAPLIRRLAQFIEPVEFDGKYLHESVKLNDMGDAAVAMQAGIDDDGITGSLASVKIPTIYKTATLHDDDWAQMFASRNRRPLIESGILRKIGEQENIIGFRGNSTLGLDGLVGSGTTDYGSPSDHWDHDDGSNGKLNHAIADIAGMKDAIDAVILSEETPLDLVLSRHPYNLLENITLTQSPQVNNLQLARSLLRGGNIYCSNWLGASESTTAGFALMIPRLPRNKANWQLLSSGFDVRDFKSGMWYTQIGARERFSIKILDATSIQWIDAIRTIA